MKRFITSPTPAANAVTELTLAVFRLNGVLLHWGDELLAPLQLTSARWQMLGALALAGAPLTAPQIGDAMGVTRQGAQKQLNLLLDQGLIETRANPAHRRSPLYVLTPDGLALYRQIDAMWVQMAEQLAKHLTAREATAALAALDTIRHALQTSASTKEIPS
jgi:DNA-binding MarR family transcriptional regulator